MAKPHPREGGYRIYSTSAGAQKGFSHQHKDCMNRSKVDLSGDQKAIAWWHCDHFIDRVNNDDAVCQFAMRVIWVTMGIACTVLGTVLFTILLR
jgi:hypothetical protein